MCYSALKFTVTLKPVVGVVKAHLKFCSSIDDVQLSNNGPL